MCRSLPVILLLLLLLFQRCTFSPDGEYISPLEQPDLSETIIEVNDPGFANPFYYKEPYPFAFTLKGTGTLSAADVKLDGTALNVSIENNRLTFVLPYDLKEGTRVVSIRLLIATNSGSLVSKLGGEFFELTNSFNVIADFTPPPDVTPTAAYENGLLTVRWLPTSKQNFKYIISRNNANVYMGIPDSTIANTSLSHFVDKGHVGGKITYSIIASGYNFKKTIGTVEVNDEPDFKIAIDDSKYFRATWQMPNVDPAGLRLSFNRRGRITNLPYAPSGSIIIDTLALAEGLSSYVEASMHVSRPGYSRQAISVYKSTTPPGQNFATKYNGYVALPGSNKIVILTEQAIHRYDCSTFELEGTLSQDQLNAVGFGSIVVSPDEKRIVVSDYNRLYSFDAASFENAIAHEEFADLSADATGDPDNLFELKVGGVSNNGIVVAQMFRSAYTKPYAVAYDIVNKTVVWWTTSSDFGSILSPVISAEGDVIAVNYQGKGKSEVYTRIGNVYTKTGTLPEGRNYFRANSHELIHVEPINNINSGQTEVIVSVFDLSKHASPGDSDWIPDRFRRFPVKIPNRDSFLLDVYYDPGSDRIVVRYFLEQRSAIYTYHPENWSMKGPYKCEYGGSFKVSHDFAIGYHFSDAGYIEKVE